MKRVLKIWLTIAVSTVVGAALGLLLAPGKRDKKDPEKLGKADGKER